MTENKDWTTVLDKTGAVCSILALISVFILQGLPQNNQTLLFWWTTTAVIAFASMITFFDTPSLIARIIFVFLFVSQVPLFNYAWSEMHDDDTDTQYEFGLVGDTDETISQQNKSAELEAEIRELKKKGYDSFLFWESISHLVGMAFSLLACTNTGQYRIRVIYEVGGRSS